MLIKRAIQADHVSGGRVGLGLGAGDLRAADAAPDRPLGRRVGHLGGDRDGRRPTGGLPASLRGHRPRPGQDDDLGPGGLVHTDDAAERRHWLEQDIPRGVLVGGTEELQDALGRYRDLGFDTFGINDGVGFGDSAAERRDRLERLAAEVLFRP
ncbi:MAG: hypothetical protein V9G19_05865 [Tetrasphaera sp.]